MHGPMNVKLVQLVLLMFSVTPVMLSIM